MDLILGLPGETIEDVRFTLDEIKKENIIIAKPGEKIAVDGEIIERKSTFR